jgi:hypothetical protein
MADRVDASGAAYAGSQMLTQLYVNVRTAELDAGIRAEFPELADATLDWRSPRSDKNFAEHWDAAFLERLDLDAHVDALKLLAKRRTALGRARHGLPAGQRRSRCTARRGQGATPARCSRAHPRHRRPARTPACS